MKPAGPPELESALNVLNTHIEHLDCERRVFLPQGVEQSEAGGSDYGGGKRR